MNEQKARENELRGTQACVEDAHMKGVMTAFNRVGVTQSNAHTGDADCSPDYLCSSDHRGSPDVCP